LVVEAHAARIETGEVEDFTLELFPGPCPHRAMTTAERDYCYFLDHRRYSRNAGWFCWNYHPGKGLWRGRLLRRFVKAPK